MRSMVAPMIAISRAARSSMRSTACASQVGLSHSTQARRPCSMDSESKGRLAGFMDGVLPVRPECLGSMWTLYEKERREFVKGKHGAFGPCRCEIGATVNLASFLIVDFWEA